MEELFFLMDAKKVAILTEVSLNAHWKQFVLSLATTSGINPLLKILRLQSNLEDVEKETFEMTKSLETEESLVEAYLAKLALPPAAF